MKVDWNLSDELPYKRGDIVKAKILKAAESFTKSNFPMFVVDFYDEAGRYICRDRIVVQGPGRKIALAKLSSLGLQVQEAISDHHLLDREVYLMLEVEEWSGEVRLAPAMEWEDHWRAGYWSVEHGKPSGVTSPDAAPAPGEIDETPF